MLSGTLCGTVMTDEELRSYDVSALFTSVPDVLSPLVGKTEHHVKNSKDFAEYVKKLKVDKAMDVIRRKLEEDESLSKRTPLSPIDIITLLEKCLKCTYFLHKGQYYLQVHGAAMGSPVSPIVCNLYMENFEQIALEKAENPPRWWKRYVDDTYTRY